MKYEKKQLQLFTNEEIQRKYTFKNKDVGGLTTGQQELMLQYKSLMELSNVSDVVEIKAYKLKLDILNSIVKNLPIYEREQLFSSYFRTGFTKTNTITQEKDFKEFCKKCGYYEPYDKQVSMMEFAFQGGTRLILGARKYGKTDYITILGTAWELYKNNNKTFLIISKNLQKVYNIIEEIGRCLSLLNIELDKQTKSELNIAGHSGKQPNICGLSIGSSALRGNHVNYILCDDIITPDDDSEAERKRVKKIYEELMKLGINDIPNITIIGQPVHSKDLYQELRVLPDIKKLILRYGEIPELDTKLEILRASGTSERSIKANYFLEIDTSVENVPFRDCEICDTITRLIGEGTVGYIDPAHGGYSASSSGDYTAFVLGIFTLEHFYVLGFIWKQSWDKCFQYFNDICQAYNVKLLMLEINGVGTYATTVLAEKIKNSGVNKVIPINNTTKKESRIMNAGMQSKGIILCKSEIYRDANKEFIDQVKNYEYQGHDDGPDALASLMIVTQLVPDPKVRRV